MGGPYNNYGSIITDLENIIKICIFYLLSFAPAKYLQENKVLLSDHLSDHHLVLSRHHECYFAFDTPILTLFSKESSSLTDFIQKMFIMYAL